MKAENVLDRIDFGNLIDELCNRNVTIAGLQLPDGLKYKSTEIIDRIEKEGFKVILSGSSSFGACDLDTFLLEDVDILIHLGHTELLKGKNIIYVPYFIDYVVPKFLDIKEKDLALISTAQYAWKLHEVKEELENRGYSVELKKGNRTKFPGQVLGCNYSPIKESKAEAILFIGDGLFHPLGAAIYSKKKVYRFSPLSNEFDVVGPEKFTKKRYMILGKVLHITKRGAILVSSKPGQKRLKLAQKLKEKSTKEGRKIDILMTDEITPYKLSNFSYGFYVNTACPRITYDDADLFPVPIITPPEFETLLGLRKWEEYKMDEVDEV